MQNYNTDHFEEAHKRQKQAARATNCKNATFERETMKQASRMQSFHQLANVSEAFRAVMNNTIKQTHIKEKKIFMEAPASPLGQQTTARLTQAIVLDPLSIANLRPDEPAQQSHLFFVVRILTTAAVARMILASARVTMGTELQVLEQFSKEQFRRRVSHSVQILQDAAGQSTPHSKQQACTQVRDMALRALVVAGVSSKLVQSMSSMITQGNIEWTATCILKTPELLTLPQTITEFLQRSKREAHNDLAHRTSQLKCMCFVKSPKAGIHFANVWDVEKQHPDHVRHSHLTCSQDACCDLQRMCASYDAFK